jgi:hypothetical protein
MEEVADPERGLPGGSFGCIPLIGFMIKYDEV